MIELDKRYNAKVRKEGGAVMAKKKRVMGQLSSAQPPVDAPAWAIKGIYVNANIAINSPCMSFC